MNFIVFCYLLVIGPKLFWDRLTKGKRHPGFFQRLGLSLPKTEKSVIWFHAVSVGEIKAARALFEQVRRREKEAFLFVTTTTATGQEEAKRSLASADAFAYLPIDLSWIARRFARHLQPKMFILVESDFWPNLLSELHQVKTQIVLVNGKMSERSFKRFELFPKFTKKLFSHFSAICVQNEEYYHRFSPFLKTREHLHITGNLKLDLKKEEAPSLNLPEQTIAISCTHAPEEELLLDALLETGCYFILAPRHPERFSEVAELLKKKQIPFSRYSKGERGGRVLLMDAMGQMPACYASCRLAIVAGSYVSHIGGHNLLEPCLYGVPTIFGPHTHGQKELASLAIKTGAGACIPINELKPFVERFFSDPTFERAMRENVEALMKNVQGATAKTLSIISG
jgi:3-deoxy-D-manno-octulosonic-acid transferase